MKKLYILWVGLLLAALFTAANNPSLFGNFAEVSTVYTEDGSFGGGTLYPAYAVVNGKEGESCRVEKEDFDLNTCIKVFDAEIIFTETVENTVSVYLYSPKIRRYKTVKGEKVNLHVALCENYVAMGSPLIYGGY